MDKRTPKKQNQLQNTTDQLKSSQEVETYEQLENTAAFYLNYMQQKSTEAFAAMKEALTDE